MLLTSIKLYVFDILTNNFTVLTFNLFLHYKITKKS